MHEQGLSGSARSAIRSFLHDSNGSSVLLFALDRRGFLLFAHISQVAQHRADAEAW
jgi:hypothetical protein